MSEITPGRIAKHNMKVETVCCEDGVERDCVMINMMPEGHHVVIPESIKGVTQSETLDDGSAIISEHQQKRKYDSVSEAVMGGVSRSAGNLACEDTGSWNAHSQARPASRNQRVV